MKRNAEVLLVIALIVLVGVSASLSFIILSVPQDDGMDLGFGMPAFMPSGRMMSSAFFRSEYDFLVHMIPHHEEAVDTAMILLDNTEREEMKEFAEGIIRTQTDEIEQMKEWLILWYPDQNHEINYQPMMRDLQGMKGAVLDEAFIEDMIPHHMAAVMMAQQLLIRGLAEHDEVAALAREIRDNQRTEIHVMMRWLAGWRGIGSQFTNLPGILVWIWIISLGIFIAAGVWLIRNRYSTKRMVSGSRSPRDLLDLRYANGEVTQVEYYIVRKELEG